MPFPNYQAAGATASGTGAVSPAWPTHQADDIALLIVEADHFGSATTLSTSAGFVEVTNSPKVSSGDATRISIFWCRATSTSMAAPTVADPGDHVIARIVTFRGCITTGNPWDVTSNGNTMSGADATFALTIAGATTTVTDCLAAIAIVREAADGNFANGWANADFANITEVLDFDVSGIGNGGGISLATGEKASAGAYGSTTVNTPYNRAAGIVVMLKPALAAPAGARSLSAMGVG